MGYLRITCLVLTLFAAAVAHAQAGGAPEMADPLRASGKIYVVVAVLAVIFAGLALYLFIIDRRVARLEKEARK